MRFSVKAKNVTRTNAIDNYLEKRLAEVDKILRDDERDFRAAVEIAKETKHHRHGKVFYAEINFHVRKKDFRAAAYGEDLYEAIDLMQGEIVREIKRHHERSRSRKEAGNRLLKKKLRTGRA
jgi:ribosomal subunit interface protein